MEWNLSNPCRRGKKIKQGGWKRKREENDPWIKKARELDGKRYQLSAAHIGLFPLMGQVFHNNYTEGIREIGFSMKEGKLILSVLEGEQEKKIQLGAEKAEIQNLDLNGEIYRIAAEGRFSTDEDGKEVLTIVLSYLEDAIKRIFKEVFHGDQIELRA